MPFTLCMPKLSPTMTEGTIAKWHKAVGQHVDADELIIEIATDKATIEHHLPDPGWLRQILAKEGDRIAVGRPLAILSADEKEPISGYVPQEVVIEGELFSASAPQPSPIVFAAVQTSVSAEEQRIAASPLAKKLSSRDGISLVGIRGTGPGGRIMSRDLEGLRPKKAPEALSFPLPEGGTLQSLTPMRQTIGRRLQYSKSNIPHFYVSSNVEVSDLVVRREELKSLGLHVTINDFLIKATSLALIAHPSLRCSYLPDRLSVFQHDHADIAVAVSLPGGLITPIVFQAETKSLLDISKEIRLLAEKAKAGKLQSQEYAGGAFTISNLGMFGIDEFVAIINPPQVAILAIGAISDIPVVKGGSIASGKVLTLTVSADHRAVDGTDAAAFLRTMKELLQDPATLIKGSQIT
jgi:pyruvate dehydrogenase E2 component (dihydrolipoamide acetyltransferase)